MKLAPFGALAFKEAPNYEMPVDANRDNVYMVTVVVTDSKKVTAMRDVTITITNVERRRDGHPIVGAAQDRNRADRHPGRILTAL